MSGLISGEIGLHLLMAAELICVVMQRSARLLSLLSEKSREISICQEIMFFKVSSFYVSLYIPEAQTTQSLEAIFSEIMGSENH